MILEAIGVISVFLALCGALNLVFKHSQYKKIPGPARDSFLLGNIFGFRKSIADHGTIGKHYLSMTQQYGVVFNFWLSYKPVVVIQDPTAVKDFLMDSSVFTKVELDAFVPKLFGTSAISIVKIGKVSVCGTQSILTSTGGPKWKRKRRLMDPAFTLNRLSTYLTRFYKVADNLVRHIESELDKSDGPSIVDMFVIGSPYTIDAISLAGFGATDKEIAILRSKNTEMRETFTSSVKNGNDYISVMLNSKRRANFYKVQKDVQCLRDTAQSMIMNRINTESYGSFHDLLDYIVTANTGEDSGTINMEETLDDFITMYAAGNATTQTTMNFLLNEVVRNPRVLEILVEEVDRVWADSCIGPDSTSDEIGETLKNMPYLDLVIKETLRMHPPVQVTLRRNTTDLNINGYTIPKGTVFHSSKYVMQNFEEYWDDPHVFRPERFAEGTPKPYTYMPFLVGPRQCIGKNFAILELKCIVAEILKRFTMAKDPDAADEIITAQAILVYSVNNTFLMSSR